MSKQHEAGNSASRLLTPAEVMARLNVSRQTLVRYVDGGHLPAVVLPSGHRRYRDTDVEALERGGAATAVGA